MHDKNNVTMVMVLQGSFWPKKIFIFVGCDCDTLTGLFANVS